MHEEFDFNDPRYDPKYNTPGLRQPKETKDPFGNFKKRMDQERRSGTGQKGRRGIRPPEREEQDPLWMQRLFLALAIPSALLAIAGVTYLLLLNAGNFTAYATGVPQHASYQVPGWEALTDADVAALPPVKKHVYAGYKALGQMDYKAARLHFDSALREEPANPEANAGLLTALRKLVRQDRGWRVQLEAHEKHMAELPKE